MKVWIEALRLRTLPVSIAGVITATGLAAFYDKFEWLPALLCLIFAVLAQIVSNLANEYYDFKRGADKKGRVGPRRGVTEGDISPKALRNLMFTLLVIAGVVGCCLIPFGGWWLLPIGLVIAVGAFAYSAGPYPLSYHGLGDVAVFLFFGLVPVNLTYYVQAHTFAATPFLASLSIGFMAINVLLINNYRDIEDDRESHKNTTVVLFGREFARAFYLFNGFMAVGFLTPLWLGLVIYGNAWTLVVPAIYLVLHLITWNKLRKRDGAELNPLLGATGRNMLIFALLFAMVLLVVARFGVIM